MEVLVPIDGSETSFRALEFALEFARRFEADVHVVHFTDAESVASEEIVDRAEGVLAEAGIEAEPEVAVDLDLDLRPGDRVGEDVVGLVEERGYDHVVMGPTARAPSTGSSSGAPPRRCCGRTSSP